MTFKRFVSRTVRTAVAAAVSGALLLSMGGPANADAPMAGADKVVARVFGAADPAAAYRALSVADRARFDHRMVPVTSLRSVTIVPADATALASIAAGRAPEGLQGIQATGCWTARANDSRRAAAGNTLYTFFTTAYWCASGNTVTTASLYEADGETSTPGWRYDGVKTSGAAVYSNQGRAYAKHRFILGVGGWDVQTTDNCLRVKGTSAPAASWDRVCGVS